MKNREMMKRSASELAFEEYLMRDMDMTTNSNSCTTTITTVSDCDVLAATARTIAFPQDVILDAPVHISGHFIDHYHHLQGIKNDVSSYEGEAAETHVLMSHNHTPKLSALDAQSSICGNFSSGSPVSACNNPKSRDQNEVKGATSGSSDRDPSDDDEDDAATDAAHSEQSIDPSYLKRVRRMLSNRESARRSRKRKQEHLADLEMQAEQLRGENDTLYKQLANANQQFRDANTNNRVFKSYVEALTANVKLAEDMLPQGSLTCGLNQLLQSHLTPSHPIATQNIRRVPNVSPTITVHGDDHSTFTGITVSGNSALGLPSIEINNPNLSNGIGTDAVSCVTDIWH